jgi:hypothetical protein
MSLNISAGVCQPFRPASHSAAMTAPLSAAMPDGLSADGRESMAARVSMPDIMVGEGMLTLKAATGKSETFHIYGITGQLIKRLDIKAGDSAQLQRGVYIVKCSHWARKIMVK